MLEIRNLQAGIEDKPILKGIDLSVNAGEVHALMGPVSYTHLTLPTICSV